MLSGRAAFLPWETTQGVSIFLLSLSLVTPTPAKSESAGAARAFAKLWRGGLLCRRSPKAAASLTLPVFQPPLPRHTLIKVFLSFIDK
jgi:hypothetical protein